MCCTNSCYMAQGGVNGMHEERAIKEVHTLCRAWGWTRATAWTATRAWR